jgi:hypothetical protein
MFLIVRTQRDPIAIFVQFDVIISNKQQCVVRFTIDVRQQQRVGIEFCAKLKSKTGIEVPDVMQDSHLGQET